MTDHSRPTAPPSTRETSGKRDHILKLYNAGIFGKPGSVIARAEALALLRLLTPPSGDGAARAASGDTP